MGARHVVGWSSAGHTVASITDLDRPRAEKLAADHGVPAVHTDFRVAVSDPDIDAVSVCMPLALHAPVTIAAARQGKHVMVEKPLAPHAADAAAMERAVSEAGVCFGVGFQRNLAPDVGALRDLAARGEFGRPMIMNSELLGQVRPKTAMHDRNGNGGPFTDAACHSFLMWQTIFRSRPATVRAVGTVAALDRPEIAHLDQLAIDTGVVTVSYESGDIGTMTASWALAKGTGIRRRTDRIIGPRGGAELTAGGMTVYSGSDVRAVTFESDDLHRMELAQFAECIRTGAQYPCGFAVGRQIMAVTAAIYESIATGQTARVVDF